MRAFRHRLKTTVLALGASLMLGSSAMGKTPAVCPTIEIAPIASLGAAASRTFPGPDGKAVAVERVSLVTGRDITKAETSYAEGAWGLGLKFSAAAVDRLRAYTTAHVGDQVAFIVQGKAKMVVKILDPNMGDGAWISPFDKPEGDKLAAGINACLKTAR